MHKSSVILIKRERNRIRTQDVRVQSGHAERSRPKLQTRGLVLTTIRSHAMSKSSIILNKHLKKFGSEPKTFASNRGTVCALNCSSKRAALFLQTIRTRAMRKSSTTLIKRLRKLNPNPGSNRGKMNALSHSSKRAALLFKRRFVAQFFKFTSQAFNELRFGAFVMPRLGASVRFEFRMVQFLKCLFTPVV